MYEFFCPDCNTIFTFFSRTVTTEKIPACPKCKRSGLTRMVSRFSFSGRAKERPSGGGENETAPNLPIDEGRMEQAMAALASEAEGVDENNPRQAANLMRRFSAMTGLKLGDKMQNALERLESGEDPESLEKDMEGLDENDLFALGGMDGAPEKRKPGRKKAPLHDETLYEM
jgi:putative FmdB family regulatory protein